MQNPELVFGILGAIGADTKLISDALESSLASVGYRTIHIHVIECLYQFPKWAKLPQSPTFDRYWAHMDAGDRFRSLLKSSHAIASLAIARIKAERQKLVQDKGGFPSKIAYILRSLKTPQEVKLLQKTYGDSFFGIAAYAPKEARKKHLMELMAREQHRISPNDKDVQNAEKLIARDESGLQAPFSQNIQDAFHLADFYLAMDDADVPTAVQRFIELVFGNPFITPSRDELGMYHAWAAALRSCDLARQVGATIVTHDFSVAATGCNEVPKAFGGHYWPNDPDDQRDVKKKVDSNDLMKRKLLEDLLERLRERRWLSQSKSRKVPDELLREALNDSDKRGIGKADLMNITEYGRAVHAEMSALTDAARRGIPVQDATLYCTTFPCHNCAKHIVSSGLKRVVFVEPYPKSQAPYLYGDSIRVEPSEKTNAHVLFEAFLGVSPRRFFDLFLLADTERKKNGVLLPWKKSGASPKKKEFPLAYLYWEDNEMGSFFKCLKKKKIPVKPVRSK